MKDANGVDIKIDDMVRVLEDPENHYGDTRVPLPTDAIVGQTFRVVELSPRFMKRGPNVKIEDPHSNWSITPDSVEVVVKGPDGNWLPKISPLVGNGRNSDAQKARQGIQVYVAGPYSEGELEKNIRIVIFAAEILVDRGARQGHHVAPWIPHLNKLWHDEVPHEYDFWLDLDFVHLSNCDACFRVGGTSPGADREEAVCDELGIPYFTCFEEYEAWLEDYDG